MPRNKFTSSGYRCLPDMTDELQNKLYVSPKSQTSAQYTQYFGRIRVQSALTTFRHTQNSQKIESGMTNASHAQ